MLVALVLTLAGGCSQPARGDVVGMWALDALVVDGTPLNLQSAVGTQSFPEAAAWIRLDPDGDLVGEGSCNDFQGRFRFDGEVLELVDVIASLVGCEQEMKIEEQFLALLWSERVSVEFETDDSSTMIWRSGRTSVSLVQLVE